MKRALSILLATLFFVGYTKALSEENSAGTEPRKSVSPAGADIDSVVIVTSFTQDSKTKKMVYSSGGGVVIWSDGKESLIATARHVVKEEDIILIKTRDSQVTADGRIVWKHRDKDVDLVVIRASVNLKPAPLCSCAKASPGDYVIVIAHPLSEYSGRRKLWFVSDGTVESTGETIFTTAYSSHGSSGGGLFKGDGCLLGIISGRITKTISFRGRSLSYPVSVLTYAESIHEDSVLSEIQKATGETVSCGGNLYKDD